MTKESNADFGFYFWGNLFHEFDDSKEARFCYFTLRVDLIDAPTETISLLQVELCGMSKVVSLVSIDKYLFQHFLFLRE